MILRDCPVDAERPDPVADSSESARVITGSVVQVVVKVKDQVIADMCPPGRVQPWLENDAIPTQPRNSMRHSAGSQARAYGVSSPLSEVSWHPTTMPAACEE